MNTEFIRHTKSIARVYGIPVRIVIFLVIFFLISETINLGLELCEIKHWIMNYYYIVISIVSCIVAKNMDDKFFEMKNIENIVLKKTGREMSIKCPCL